MSSGPRISVQWAQDLTSRSPEDEQFSVVPKKKVKDGVPVGGTCSIKIGKQLHQAKILAVGKYT